MRLVCDPVSELYGAGGFVGSLHAGLFRIGARREGEWTGIEGASWRGGVSGQRIVVFLCRGVRSFESSEAALLSSFFTLDFARNTWH